MLSTLSILVIHGCPLSGVSHNQYWAHMWCVPGSSVYTCLGIRIRIRICVCIRMCVYMYIYIYMYMYQYLFWFFLFFSLSRYLSLSLYIYIYIYTYAYKLHKCTCTCVPRWRAGRWPPELDSLIFTRRRGRRIFRQRVI